ncbi:hypothetical protein ACMD2_21086, partial [Ananas comosus]
SDLMISKEQGKWQSIVISDCSYRNLKQNYKELKISTIWNRWVVQIQASLSVTRLTLDHGLVGVPWIRYAYLSVELACVDQ